MQLKLPVGVSRNGPVTLRCCQVGSDTLRGTFTDGCFSQSSVSGYECSMHGFGASFPTAESLVTKPLFYGKVILISLKTSTFVIHDLMPVFFGC